jgi:hypothetical protein
VLKAISLVIVPLQLSLIPHHFGFPNFYHFHCGDVKWESRRWILRDHVGREREGAKKGKVALGDELGRGKAGSFAPAAIFFPTVRCAYSANRSNLENPRWIEYICITIIFKSPQVLTR